MRYNFCPAHCKSKPYLYFTSRQIKLDILKSKASTVPTFVYERSVLQEFFKSFTADIRAKYSRKNVVVHCKRRWHGNVLEKLAGLTKLPWCFAKGASRPYTMLFTKKVGTLVQVCIYHTLCFTFVHASCCRLSIIRQTWE